jgi:hypothetical protein
VVHVAVTHAEDHRREVGPPRSKARPGRDLLRDVVPGASPRGRLRESGAARDGDCPSLPDDERKKSIEAEETRGEEKIKLKFLFCPSPFELVHFAPERRPRPRACWRSDLPARVTLRPTAPAPSSVSCRRWMPGFAL